jgi:hypothetical protein
MGSHQTHQPVSNPQPVPTKTRTHRHRYRFSWVWVQVVSVDTHPVVQSHCLLTPILSMCLNTIFLLVQPFERPNIACPGPTCPQWTDSIYKPIYGNLEQLKSIWTSLESWVITSLRLARFGLRSAHKPVWTGVVAALISTMCTPFTPLLDIFDWLWRHMALASKSVLCYSPTTSTLMH